jgi:hypothetical protein
MEKYYLEYNGEQWQSVFPTKEAENSQLHNTLKDGIEYFRELGINNPIILN